MVRDFDELLAAMPAHARERAAFRAKAILDRMAQPIQHVRQEHANGCAIAAIAMVTRLTYREVLAELPPLIEERVRGNGLGTMFETFQALQRLGYAVAPEWRGEWGRPRPEWKPQPVGNINIAEVTVPGGGHMVAVLADGAVLDPAKDAAPRSLAEYDVNWIAAVVPLG